MKQIIKDIVAKQMKYGAGFAPYHKLISGFRENSIQENKLLQNELFMHMVHKVVTKNSFYQRFYGEYGVNFSLIQSIDDISMLPELNKEVIRDVVDELYMGGVFKTKGYTSGTTGSPLEVWRSAKSVWKEAAYIQTFRELNGHKLGDSCISLRGDLGREKMFRYDQSINTCFLSSYHINPLNTNFYLEKLKQHQPNAILAYPSSVYALALLLDEINEQFYIPLVFTSSETLYSFQKELIQRVFGCEIFDRYGNAERTISLEQQKDGNYVESPLYSINRFEKERVITTNLFNFDFPLINYVVEDGFELNKDSTIAKIHGRKDDVVVLSDGSSIGRLDIAFKGIRNLKEAQIIQDSLTVIRVNIIVTSGWEQNDQNKLIANLRKLIGETIHIQINMVEPEEIIRTSANKFKLVINNRNE